MVKLPLHKKKILVKKLPALLYVLLFFIATPVLGAELHLALADSTCTAMKKSGDMFTRRTNIDLTYTCKSSGLLAKGIQAGVIKADFFLSANKKWMDHLVNAGFIDPSKVETLLANELVVVSNPSSSFTMSRLEDLKSPEVKTIIIGTPDKAPFGRYAKQALEKAGLWQDILPKITSRKNISLAIETLEEKQDGLFGVLYRTGLKETLRLQLTIPETLHDPIRYYSGALNASVAKEGVSEFLSFLKEDEFQKIFSAAGFIVLP